MGVIYEKNNIVPHDKNYDIVKYVPYGYVLSRLDDPGAVYYQGQYVGVKNGIKVNDPDSNWVLETLDEYVQRTGDESIYEKYDINVVRVDDESSFPSNVSTTELKKEELVVSAKQLLDEENLEENKDAQEYVGFVASILLLEDIIEETGSDRDQLIRDAVLLDKKEFARKYSVSPDLEHVLDFLEDNKARVLRIFKNLEGTKIDSEDRELLKQISQELYSLRNLEEPDKRQKSFDETLLSHFFDLMASIAIRSGVETLLKNYNKSIRVVLELEEPRINQIVKNGDSERILDNLMEEADKIAYEGKESFDLITSYFFAYFFTKWFPGEDFKKKKEEFLNKIYEKISESGFNVYEAKDKDLRLSEIAKDILVSFKAFKKEREPKQKTTSIFTKDTEDIIKEIRNLENSDINTELKNAILRISHLGAHVRFLEKLSDQIESAIFNTSTTEYVDRFGNLRKVDTKMLLYTALIFPQILNNVPQKEKFIEKYSNLSKLFSDLLELSEAKDEEYEEYKEIVENALLTANRILLGIPIKESEINYFAKSIAVKADSFPELLDVLSIFSSVLLKAFLREKPSYKESAITYSTYAVWESILAKVGLSKKLREFYKNLGEEYSREEFLFRKEKEINSILLSGLYMFRYTPMMVKINLQNKVDAFNEIFKRTIEALGEYEAKASLVGAQKASMNILIDSLDRLFEAFKKSSRKILENKSNGFGFSLVVEQALDDFRKVLERKSTLIYESLRALFDVKFPKDIQEEFSSKELELLKLINTLFIGMIDSLNATFIKTFLTETFTKGNFETLAHSVPLARFLMPKIKVLTLEEMLAVSSLGPFGVVGAFSRDIIEDDSAGVPSILAQVENASAELYTKSFNHPLVFDFLRFLEGSLKWNIDILFGTISHKEDKKGEIDNYSYKYNRLSVKVPTVYKEEEKNLLRTLLRESTTKPLTESARISEPEISFDSFLLREAFDLLAHDVLDDFATGFGKLNSFNFDQSGLSDLFLDQRNRLIQKRYGTVKTLQENKEIEIRDFGDYNVESEFLEGFTKTIAIPTMYPDIDKVLIYKSPELAIYATPVAAFSLYRDFLEQVLTDEELEEIKKLVVEKKLYGLPSYSKRLTIAKEILDFAFRVYEQRKQDPKVREAFSRAVSRYLIPLFTLLPFDKENRTVVHYATSVNPFGMLRNSDRLVRAYKLLKLSVLESIKEKPELKDVVKLLEEIAFYPFDRNAAGRLASGANLVKTKRLNTGMKLYLRSLDYIEGIMDYYRYMGNLRKEILFRSLEKEFLVKGFYLTGSGEVGVHSTLFHELGHAIDFMLTNNYFAEKLPKRLKEVVKRYRQGLGEIYRVLYTSLLYHEQTMLDILGPQNAESYSRVKEKMVANAISFISGNERSKEVGYETFNMFYGTLSMMAYIEKEKVERGLSSLANYLKKNGVLPSLYGLFADNGVEIPSVTLESYATSPLFAEEYTESYERLIKPMLEFAKILAEEEEKEWKEKKERA